MVGVGSVLVGVLIVLVGVMLTLGLVWRPLTRAVLKTLLNAMADRLMTRIVADKYSENLFGVLNVVRHVGAQTFVETMMRAVQAKPISRPMGSPLHPSPWHQLLFQPVYLRPRLPTPEDTKIETTVVIGARAERPLNLDIPIAITAMSYGGALSIQAKVAMAKGANLAGTATNTGESYLPEERDAATRLIVQHHRGLWPNGTMNRPGLLGHADAIEIQLGQGAQAAAAMQTAATSINAKMREVYGLDPGEPARLATRFGGVNSAEDFVAMVKRLKNEHPVPVGVKVGVGDYIEEDLEVFLEAGVDFVTIDGAEGGTHGGPPTLEDDVGLPTMHGLVRAADYLTRAGARDRLSLVAAGGLTTPGAMLKALALGADAVYIGTVAVVATLSEQMKKTLPFEPPYDLVMHSASPRWNRALDTDQAATRLAGYLRSCVGDMTYVAASVGKTSLGALDRTDLVALDAAVADLCGVRLAWRPRSEEPVFGAGQAVTATRKAPAQASARPAGAVVRRSKLAAK